MRDNDLGMDGVNAFTQMMRENDKIAVKVCGSPKALPIPGRYGRAVLGRLTSLSRFAR